MIKHFRKIIVISVILLLLSSSFPVFAVDILQPSDFDLDSWSKNIDFFDYVRQYATLHGKIPPKETDHAYLNLVYINSSGLHVLSAGLFNITDEENVLTIPIQTTMMHYTTNEDQKDVVTASSFVMLLAFNETASSLPNQLPDKTDTLYASFSLGYNLDTLFEESKPDLNSETEVIPLKQTDNGLVWTWGMKYTNLAALWWKTSIDPANPKHEPRPVALTVYDELTFTYELKIDPNTGEAKLSTNYVIGKMRDLWLFTWLLVVPIPLGHYNSTGCYTMKGQQLSTVTIHDFIHNQGIQMSTINFQATAILDHTAYFESEGTNVQDNEIIIDDSTIETFADDGEKILDANFTTKESYKLFDYTVNPMETTYETYQTKTKTSKIAGFARNPIFAVHTSLMKLIPAVMINIDPELYDQAKDHLLDMNYADYFYITSYPTYDGYRIEHDPTITAYCHLTTTEALSDDSLSIGSVGALFLVAIGVILVVAFAFILKKRKRNVS